jgi:UDP-N-acetylenolpyruvoylglucosamine reductase
MIKNQLTKYNFPRKPIQQAPCGAIFVEAMCETVIDERIFKAKGKKRAAAASMQARFLINNKSTHSTYFTCLLRLHS